MGMRDIVLVPVHRSAPSDVTFSSYAMLLHRLIPRFRVQSVLISVLPPTLGPNVGCTLAAVELAQTARCRGYNSSASKLPVDGHAEKGGYEERWVAQACETKLHRSVHTTIQINQSLSVFTNF